MAVIQQSTYSKANISECVCLVEKFIEIKIA